MVQFTAEDAEDAKGSCDIYLPSRSFATFNHKIVGERRPVLPRVGPGACGTQSCMSGIPTVPRVHAHDVHGDLAPSVRVASLPTPLLSTPILPVLAPIRRRSSQIRAVQRSICRVPMHSDGLVDATSSIHGPKPHPRMGGVALPRDAGQVDRYGCQSRFALLLREQPAPPLLQQRQPGPHFVLSLPSLLSDCFMRFAGSHLQCSWAMFMPNEIRDNINELEKRVSSELYRRLR